MIRIIVWVVLTVVVTAAVLIGIYQNQVPTADYPPGYMVSLVHADDQWFCVLDNNYPGVDKYEWMTPDEFRRSYTGGRAGWSVILLDPGPPPPPRN